MLDAERDKAKQGEDELQSWFNRHGFGYVAICQNKGTFAHLFRNDVKRPDFLLLVDSIGMIAVDAKYRKLYSEGYTLPHDEEFERALMFERIFRLPVWYAYRGVDADTWHWISALKVQQVGNKRVNAKGAYMELKASEFECLRTGADFAKLYTQRMPGLKKLRSVKDSTNR